MICRVRKLLKLSKNTEGVTAIEFALLLPILAILTVGTMELGLIIFCKIVLEGATSNSGRVAKIGDTRAELPREQYIRSEVERMSVGLMRSDELDFSIKVVGTVEGDENNVGAGGELVVITTSYPWPIFTPLVGEFFENNQYVVQATTTFRNEPF